ncbi:MAG: sulfate ABC transporter permease subunit CysT [Xanthomonadaceae bacterium]|nr:sulfate ABC transporter permease subunit CysT [Xanthomonadaceae bacterium]
MPRTKRVLPGFGLTLGTTLLFVAIIILLPLAGLVLKAGGLGLQEFWSLVTSERALASYKVTLGSALGASVFNLFLGLLLAWILVRYRFPGRTMLDAVIDLPFALPTAVAGLALTGLFAGNGWYGKLLEPLGIQVAYTTLGITVAMAFTTLPFVVRSVQPVLEDLEPELEEAAQTLGATAWQTFRRVIFPPILPALLSGFVLSLARGLGEFGAVIFIAGNMPYETEVISLLIMIRLEEYDYASAAALASVMLAAAFALLISISLLQGYLNRHSRKS